MKLFYKKISWIDSEDVYMKLFKTKNNVFWLDSSRVEKGLSQFSYMGKAKKVYTYSLQKKQKNIFTYMQEELQKQKITSSLPFDFVGGFVGYFGYELKALTGSKNHYVSDYPDSMWFFVDRFLAFDHLKKEVYLVCLCVNKKSAQEWFTKIEKNLCRKIQENTKDFRHQEIVFTMRRNRKQYLFDIQKCKEFLQKGESYQICLTNTITTKLHVNPIILYMHLRKENPAPYAAFLKHNDVAILCSSPERFLKIDSNGNVETKPIKGTIKRSKNPQTDISLANQLLASEKDRAENLMITDLLRNDVGKVCTIGSVKVPKLITLESYQTVHQLVSTIVGKLQKGKIAIDCITACFPGGSMTGAPKLRTMEIIDSLEKKARGIYSGSLGFLSFSGAADLNIIIRTIVQQKNNLTIGAGGAVLIQSDKEKEYEEMLLKAKVLLETITHAVHAKKYIIKE